MWWFRSRITHSDTVYFPTDRDARRFDHIGKLVDRFVGTGARPYYDSVVIAGAGFTATIMAARLARSEQFHGKVVLAGPRTEESRRLKDGATLRGHGTDLICYALGVPQCAYVDALYGDIIDGRGVGTRNLLTMAKKGPSGAYEFARIASLAGRTYRVFASVVLRRAQQPDAGRDVRTDGPRGFDRSARGGHLARRCLCAGAGQTPVDRQREPQHRPAEWQSDPRSIGRRLLFKRH